MTAPWITYRPQIKVLDCTIRDGGLINDHRFDDAFVRAVYQACVEAGIDYMEVGYKSSKQSAARDKFGDWKFCDEDDLRRIVGDNPTPLKLSVMADAGKSDWRTDMLPKQNSVLRPDPRGLLRAPGLGSGRHDQGRRRQGLRGVGQPHGRLHGQGAEIDQALEVLAATPASTLVVVDSFGSLYAEQIELLVKKYLDYGKATGKEVGIHAHNNQQLAFANTIEAIIHGANRIDATMGGLGRGAGNCPMELLIGFLAQPQVPDPADLPGAPGPARAAEPAAGMGAVRAVQHHRAAQSASAHGDRRPRRRQPRQLPRFLRQGDQRRIARDGIRPRRDREVGTNKNLCRNAQFWVACRHDAKHRARHVPCRRTCRLRRVTARHPDFEHEFLQLPA